jgi:hypothetical protein
MKAARIDTLRPITNFLLSHHSLPRLLATNIVALWTVDVIVGLGLGETGFSAEPLPGRWTDLVGLRQAEVPLALPSLPTTMRHWSYMQLL